MAIAWRK